MNSDGYSYERCVRIVSALDMNRSIEEQFGKYLSSHDLNQLLFSCQTERDAENSDSFSKPMVWIGIYVAIASFFCILAKAADLLYGFGDKEFWFPCKYFSRNGDYITVISVTVKLPVDLSSAMPSYTDQAAKLGSLAFMCTMMANITPSLVSMDNDTLLATVIGTQLQSFGPSRYTGSARLCGLSLSKYCPGDKELEGPPDTRENIDDKEGTNDLQRWFYIGGATGFVTGFWMVCIALLVNRRGRHVFFSFYGWLRKLGLCEYDGVHCKTTKGFTSIITGKQG